MELAHRLDHPRRRARLRRGLARRPGRRAGPGLALTPIHPATWGPAPAVQLLAYPGLAPTTSWIHRDAGVLLLDDPSIEALDHALDRLDAAPRSARTAVICAGSNANPAQVVRKLAPVQGDRTVPHLWVPLTGAGPVFSAHVARYGAIPATFDRLPGASGFVHVGWYTPEQLAAVRRSEAGAYDLVVIDDPTVVLPLREPVHVWLSHAGPHQSAGAPVPLSDQRALLATLLGPGLSPEAYARDPEPHKPRLRAALTGAPHRLLTRD